MSEKLVIVTGFGEFVGHEQGNASWEAVKLLPDSFICNEQKFRLKKIKIPVVYADVDNAVDTIWGETPSVESLSKSTKGINLSNLEEVIQNHPDVINTQPQVWQLRYDFLKQNGFLLKDFVKMIANYPQILKKPEKNLLHSIDCWRATQFGEKDVALLLETYPHLFECTETVKLLDKVEMLRAYLGSRKKVFTIFMNSPGLAFTKLNEIKIMIDYVEDKMGCTSTDILKSKVFSSTLENLKYRHIFLERLGVFKPLKRSKPHKANNEEKATAQNKNPSLHHIIDTNDKKFATKVGFVTLEEYEVFCELYKRELEKNEQLLDDEGESTDTDREEEIQH